VLLLHVPLAFQANVPLHVPATLAYLHVHLHQLLY
jgi:hypothetical protein